jgi:integrase
LKGTRPLTPEEIRLVAAQFFGKFAIRNRSLFLLGISVGGRISEMLALTLGDVWQNHQPVSDLLFLKGVVKGKENARMVPVNADGNQAIADLIDWHTQTYNDLSSPRPLFPSRKGRGAFAMTRKTGHIVLKEAFVHAGLNGKLATHSLRKSYAQRLYDASGDIYLVQELLGHKNVSTTQKYLGVSYAKAQQASEAIEISRTVHNVRGGEMPANRNIPSLLLHSSSNPEHTLILEIQRQNQIIDRLTRLLDREENAPPVSPAGLGDNVIRIDDVRRKRWRESS